MLRLRWDEFGKPMGLDGTATPEFSFYDDDRRLASARVAIPFDLASRLGGPSQAALENALFRFAVPRFEALAIAGEVPEDYTIEPVFIRTTPDDASEIAGYVEEVKECVYQITADGGDLYCGAAGEGDETAVGSIGLRRVAPTSRAICLTQCGLPSTDIICSHLSHPQVVGSVTGGGRSRMLGQAVCELGKPGAVRAAESCRPNGHDCWERLFRVVRDSDEQVEVPPLAVTEALDFLDAVWELRFKRKLLRKLPTTVVAGLALPVRTRDDFKARMRDLGALDAVEVTDEQLGLQPGDPRVDGPFNRVKKLLGVELDGITTMQKIIGLRVALQHPDKANKLHENFDFLGIAYPPKDWSEAWKRVSVRAVRALGEIREEVRSGTPAK